MRDISLEHNQDSQRVEVFLCVHSLTYPWFVGPCSLPPLAPPACSHCYLNTVASLPPNIGVSVFPFSLCSPQGRVMLYLEPKVV